MSVLKTKRSESKAEFVNTANKIYILTINFLSRLSSRYSRLVASSVATLASEVLDHCEKANSIYPSDSTRKELIKWHEKLILNKEVKSLCDDLVHTIPGEYGLPLGVESSQVEMIAFPSSLDNFIKCQLRLKGGGHYMDDYYILVPPDRDPKEVLAAIVEKAESLKLTISRSKNKNCS